MHVESNSADSTNVVIARYTSAISTDEILSIINSSRELDISGITVEFYPPVIDGVAWLGQDSAHPDIRAAPKSLSIDNAKAREQAQAATHQTAATAGEDTVNVQLRQSAAQMRTSDSATDTLRPADWVTLISILTAVIIPAIIIIIYKLRR